MADPSKYHRQTVLIGGGDDLVVADRATGLDDRANPMLGPGIDAIATPRITARLVDRRPMDRGVNRISPRNAKLRAKSTTARNKARPSSHGRRSISVIPP